MYATILMKLDPSPEQAAVLVETMKVFNQACNEIAYIAHKNKTARRIGLCYLAYHKIRDKYGLPSAMTNLAITRVASVCKRDLSKQPKFHRFGSVSYGKRAWSWNGKDTVSLSTVRGRLKVRVVFGQYQAERLAFLCERAELVYRDGSFYLYVTVDLPEEAAYEPGDWLGVDLGIVNIATDSDGVVYAGNHLNGMRRRYDRIRRRLQSKRTRSSTRLLMKRRRKEKRFARHTNHIIAKALVAKAKRTGRGIVLENLKGIRERIRVRKAQRRTQHSWSFGMLRAFIEYKARLAGVPVLLVDPRNSSRTCPNCGHVSKANRVSQSEFVCRICGFAGLADFVAAVNLRHRARLTAGPLSVRPYAGALA